jgi:hypothetical protein
MLIRAEVFPGGLVFWEAAFEFAHCVGEFVEAAFVRGECERGALHLVAPEGGDKGGLFGCECLRGHVVAMA